MTEFSNISQNYYDPRHASADRTIYFKTNGNDTLDGQTEATAVATIAQAITLAAALTPTFNDPVTIISNESEIFNETVDLPDNVNLFAPGIRILANDASNPALDMGSNCRVNLDTIENQNASQPTLLFNGTSAGLIEANNIQHSAGNNAVKVTGNAYLNFIHSKTFFGGQSGSAVILQESSSTLYGLHIEADIIAVSSNTGVAIECTGANPIIVDSDSIDQNGGSAGFTGIKTSGKVHINVDEINTDGGIAMVAESGGTILAYVGDADGAITADAGGLIDLMVLSHTAGAVTATGTINGVIEGSYYGSWVAAAVPVYEIDHTDSPYTPVVGTAVIVMDDSAGNIIVNLPALSELDQYWLKRKTASPTYGCTINANGAETIDGSGSIPMNTSYVARHLVATSSEWLVI